MELNQNEEAEFSDDSYDEQDLEEDHDLIDAKGFSMPTCASRQLIHRGLNKKPI